MTSFEHPTDENPEPIRSLGRLAVATSVLLGLASLTAAGAAFALFSRAGLIDDLDLTTEVTLAELDELRGADSLVIGVHSGLGLAILATAVVFIIWQYRYARNAVVLRGRRLVLGPGWAIGGWFIPLGNLVLPFLQIRHSARASDPEPDRGTVPGIVTAWTIFCIAAFVIFNFAVQLKGSNSGPFIDVSQAAATFTRADVYQGVSLLALAVAGVLAFRMVRELTYRQELAATARPSTLIPPSTPTF